MGEPTASELVFAATLAATFGAALLARNHSARNEVENLGDENLNRWLVGLSAGTTANSGFIVTGAVGLGYAYGLQWVLLPISWLLGDIIFWYFFPARINQAGRISSATTLSELLVHGLSGRLASIVSLVCSVVILICLTGYTSAQWMAGQKFLSSAFLVPDWFALVLFALIIISYSSIGGFRGSVYTDTVQAAVRIVGTVVALCVVVWFALSDQPAFLRNIAAAEPHFLDLIPGGIIATLGFVSGFAAAAIGFGLGQPQIVSRYLAGSSPEETRSAWWIYMGFVQFTWIAMTAFGVILRGVMPGIGDPETGLSAFFQASVGPFLTGIIVADVFATIAATSNGLLVAMAQAINHDVLPALFGKTFSKLPVTLTTLVVGMISMVASLAIHGSVVNIALSSVSLLGAGLAAAVMIKVMCWRHTAASLLLAICAGVVSAVVWKAYGMSSFLNEAGIGIGVGLIVNWTSSTLLDATARSHGK